MTGQSDPLAPGRLLVASSVRWDYLWQRQQALAVAAAESGWEVDFLPPHPRNVRHVLDTVGRAVRRRLGRGEQTPAASAPAVPAGVRLLPMSAWLRRPAEYHMVVAYIPDRWTEWLIGASSASAVVYDAVLDWAAVPADWYPPIGWRSAERRLGASATAVTTDSPGMQAALAARGVEATVVYPAADDAFIDAATSSPAPRTGVYFGAVRSETDTDVLTALAAAGISVHIIGVVDSPAQKRELIDAGVVVHPPVDVATLSARIQDYEFVLLPYTGARSSSIVPAKIWNSLASGRWVIASGLSLGFESLNLVQLPDDPAAVLAAVLDRTGTTPPAGSTPPTWGERWREVVDSVSRASSGTARVRSR